MVHLRINEKEPNPNPHINFITVLPLENNESARQLLRALAAQVKPVMKRHGFAFNSFEEYEWNRVFAGRNWNEGETVEIVLRRSNGTFLSTPWLLNVLCHELAHIKHMNHGAAFQSLWTSLRSEVLALQTKAYFGDGYWSSGQRLIDSVRVGGEGLEPTDFPEYLCGGAQSRSRPKALKRSRNIAGPSNQAGIQPSKKRKAGSRVKKDFGGQGVALNEGLDKNRGTGFRKKAQSNRARAERALAAENRLRALQNISQRNSEPGSATDSESENEIGRSAAEQDEDRRQRMLETMREGDADLNTLGGQSKIDDFKDFFRLPPFTSERQQSSRQTRSAIDLTIDEDDNDDPGCDIQPLLASKSSISGVTASTSDPLGSAERPKLLTKRKASQVIVIEDEE